MTSILKFNNNVDNFINDLILIYPEFKNKLKLIKEKISFIPNKKLLINNFISHAYIHKDYIMNKNEDFFLQLYKDKGKESIDGMKEENDVVNKSFLNSLNVLELRDKLSDVNKETIWTYLRVFCVLSERYIIEETKN